MSARRNPFEDLERIFERMSREFEEATQRWESSEPYEGWESRLESMAVDLVDHDDEFVVTADLPGFEREDVTVTVTDHQLRIEADREQAIDDEDEQYLRHERRHRSTSRTIRLPDDVDKERVNARMKNGVLTITLPKLEVEQARHIDVE